jgi:hypothetical protein
MICLPRLFIFCFLFHSARQPVNPSFRQRQHSQESKHASDCEQQQQPTNHHDDHPSSVTSHWNLEQ